MTSLQLACFVQKKNAAALSTQGGNEPRVASAIFFGQIFLWPDSSAKQKRSNDNTRHAAASCVSAWFRTLRDAQKQMASSNAARSSGCSMNSPSDSSSVSAASSPAAADRASEVGDNPRRLAANPAS